MSGLRVWFREAPFALRWTLLAVVVLLVVVAIGSAVWTWQGRREAAARQALAPVLATAQQSLSSGAPADLEAAAKALRDFLAIHSGARAGGQGWYALGQVEFRRRQWDPAIAAFTEVSRRERTGALPMLSRLGMGNGFESKGEPALALGEYERALTLIGPKDFLYGDFLLAKARVQEQSKDAAGAIATYQRYLKDLPSSDRVQDVRIRLALLGSAG